MVSFQFLKRRNFF